jgi:hypothetical protein
VLGLLSRLPASIYTAHMNTHKSLDVAALKWNVT